MKTFFITAGSCIITAVLSWYLTSVVLLTGFALDPSLCTELIDKLSK